MIAPPLIIPKPGQVNFSHRTGHHLATATDGDFREFHLTLRPEPGEHLSSVLSRAQQVLREHSAVIVRQQVFGRSAAKAGAMKMMQLCFGKISWPVTWVDGIGSDGGDLAGMHLLAVAGTKVKSLSSGGRTVGTVWEDGWARHLHLGQLVPKDDARPAGEQARQVFATMAATLAQAGMDFPNIARTWFFLEDIDSWYDTFNQVRNQLYDCQPAEWLPASTGVGTRHAQPARLVAEAWALQSLGEGVSVREVPSPLQCSAPKYGSRFARATEVATPALRRLTISGTASIAPGGASVHDGDMAAQVKLTMKVIEAILQARGLSFAQTSRLTAYFKNIQDAPHLERWCAERRWHSPPLLMVQADICRPELLFEVEMDALAPA